MAAANNVKLNLFIGLLVLIAVIIEKTTPNTQGFWAFGGGVLFINFHNF
jgi:hypothetical protein